MTNYQNLSGTEDAGSEYFWTVEAYEQVKSQTNSGTKDYVLINTDSKTIYKDFEARYNVRVWKKKKVNGVYVEPSAANPATPLYHDDGVRVVLLQSWLDANSSKLTIGTIVQTSAGSAYPYPKNTSSKFPYYVDSSTNSDNSKEIFYFNLQPKKSGVSATPRIYVRLLANSDENPGAIDKEVLPAMNIPTVSWTNARMDPSVPKQVKDFAWNQNYITIDKCSTPNQWVAIVRTSDINPLLVNYVLRRWSLDGLKCTFTGAISPSSPEGFGSLGPDQFIGFDLDMNNPNNVNKDFKGSDKKDSKQDAIKAFLAIRTNTCGKAIDDNGNGNSGITDSKPVPIDMTNRTNPPNHYVTRDVSYFNRVRSNIIKDLGNPRASSEYIVAYDRIDLLKTELTEKSGRLGMIFQDADSAAALNDPGSKSSPWGFRFTYNPTSISYTTSMDTSVDWMLADKDPANYVGGNVSVGFTLYLNRIADMTELAPKKGKPGGYDKNYPRPLREEEVQGILNRGTEYDLEFLYRVLNGDPKPSSTLFTYTSEGKPALTSDFGYITGTPVWLKIHNNLRYKGSVASVSVNHVIFNEFMVPMFSTVDINMIRYPIISEAGTQAQEGFAKKKKQYVANTNATPKTD